METGNVKNQKREKSITSRDRNVWITTTIFLVWITTLDISYYSAF